MLFGTKIVKMSLCQNSIENIVIFILDLKQIRQNVLYVNISNTRRSRQ